MNERHFIDEEARKARERRINKGWVAYILIGFLFVLMGIAATFKFITTATINAPKWKEVAKHQFPPPQLSSPVRGNIYSDIGTPLAISVPRYDARIDFQAGGFISEKGHSDSIFMADVDSFAIVLSNVLKDRSVAAYKRSLMDGYNKRNRAHRLIGREISHIELNEIKKAQYLRNRGPNTTGFYTVQYIRRVRPYDNLASRTVGGLMTDPDSLGITHGNSGLELRFDSLLCGKPGLDRIVRVPPRFERVPIHPAVNGMDVYTTINVDIQDITEQALRKEVEASEAAWGTAIVMEVKTGAIKALSNLDRSSNGGYYYESTNHALADLIEPGSTFKVISMAAALETGKISPEDTVDVGNGLYHYARGLTIRDWNASRGGYGKLTRYEVIYNSSNVGTALSVLQAYGQENRQGYLDQLNKMNVFDQIDFEIPGTTQAIFKQDVSTWTNSTMPWSSYGYEVLMPPIYTLRFYNAIANNGVMMEPYLVSEVSSKNGKAAYKRKPEVINKKILSNETLEVIKKMLRGVVEEGTAKKINSPFIKIAGKTGTANISTGGGYSGRANVTFCGYFPSDNPIYSCIVVVGRPNVNSSGIPARVLKEIAEKTVANKQTTPLKSVLPDSLATFTMNQAAGNRKAIKQATKISGVDSKLHGRSADWVKREVTEGGYTLVATTPQEDVMPDLIGMSAMDAVFLAEKVGLKVNLQGHGGLVQQQSRNAGSKISRGQEVILTLK